MPVPGKQPVLGVPVSVERFLIPESLEARQSSDGLVVTFVNPYACALTAADASFTAKLESFDWVLCDGIGMAVAARKLAGLQIDRAAFDLASIAGPVLGWFAQRGIPLVLVGGREGIAVAAAERFNQLFPELQVEATFAGYDGGPTRAMELLARQTDCGVICSMGAPRQEDFLLQARAAGWRGFGFTCGGFFDQVANRIDYYPQWINWMNVRFLYRLYREPKRLWRRYLIDYQVFVRRFVKAVFSQ